MELKTELRQKLSLSARMQQCMSVLAMDYAQLEEYVLQQAMENPMIELEDLTGAVHETAEVLHVERAEEDVEMTGEEYPAGEEEHRELYFQLSGYQMPEPVRRAAEFIIESLDENGYLQETLADVAEAVKVGEPEAEEGLRIVQKLEPCGVGARSLEECLELQLLEKGADALDLKVVRTCLELCAAGRYEQIARRLDVSEEAARNACKRIRGLDPKPYRNEGSVQRIRYLTADVLVARFQSRYDVMLNPACFPNIRISQDYIGLLEGEQDPQIRGYVREHLERALWLRDCVEKRKDTILAVAGILAERQQKFLEMGPKGLEPLRLKEVAAKLQVHPSTVSRTIKNKYIQTGWGIYPLKYFFSSGMESEQGEISTAQIRYAIRRIIEKEDETRPYSDSAITQILQERGIHITRRTVASYRDQMEIPSSTIRKKVL